MTEKELHKLSRENLLQLLLSQSREVSRRKEEYSSLLDAKSELESGYERLKAKLDEKDETIERLKDKLNEKDALLEKLKGRLDEKDALLNQRESTPSVICDDRAVTMEKENDRLQLLLTAQTDELERLHRELSGHEEELTKLRDTQNAAEPEDWLDLDLVIEEFNEKNRALRDLLDTKDAQIAALHSQLENSEGFMTEIRDELRSLHAAFDQGDANGTALLREENERLKNTVAEKDALIRALVARSGPSETGESGRRPRLWERG
ncbi:MAG: hypothetical protein IJV41_07660 [Oscillospiraceae bacterium]|nr:hypothetical protein [Oscillospiraceae bacterium]